MIRRRLREWWPSRATVALLALMWLGVLAAGLLCTRPTAASDPWPSTPDVVESGQIGANLDRSELDAADLSGRLAALADNGFTWIRFEMAWDDIEPKQGRFEWTMWDSVFRALADEPRLQVIAVLNGAPSWAQAAEDAGNRLAPPRENDDFGAFAARVAARYSDQLKWYQIWDEPNIAPHWGVRPVDASEYASLLRASALRLREADPDAMILTAALAPNLEPGGANQSDLLFLDDLLASGGSDWLDAVAVQPYGFSEQFDAPAGASNLNFRRAELLHDVLTRNGAGEIPVWATAFGWNALPAEWKGQPSPWGQVSADEQAENAVGALRYASERWSWMGPMLWAANCPALDASNPWQGFSLCDNNGKPSALASTLSSAVAGTVLAPGNHRTDSPKLRYSERWQVTNSAADPAGDGDTLEFDFYGTGVALYVQGGNFWGYYLVTVDGGLANSLPVDEAGASYLVLYDPLAELRTVILSDDLSTGVHHVRLETVGGWGQWALRGIQVTDGTPQQGRMRVVAALLLLAGLVTLLATKPIWSAFLRLASFLNERIELAERRVPRWLLWVGAAVAALGFIVSEGPIGIVPLVIFASIIVVDPLIALPFATASIPFWPVPKSIMGQGLITYELVVWLALAATAARWGLRRISGESGTANRLQRPTRWISVCDTGVLLLMLVAILSTLQAERIGVASRELRTVFVDGLALYALIVWGGSESEAGKRVRVAWDGAMLGLMGVSLVALLQLLTGQGLIGVEGVWRVRAFYGSPNNLALVLDRGVPVALSMAAFGLMARGDRRPSSMARSVFHAVASALMTIAAVATFSKGAILIGLPVAFVLVLAVGGWRSHRRWPWIALMALILIGAMSLPLLFHTQRFADLLNFEGGTTFARVQLWRGSLRMALDHALFGVGPDNFLYAYRTTYVLPSAWQELNLSHPHNIVLDFWTRLGIVGLALGAFLFYTALRLGWRAILHKEAESWPLALGVTVSLVVTIAHGMIDNSVFLIDLMALFALSLGTLRVLATCDQRSPDVSPRRNEGVKVATAERQ